MYKRRRTPRHHRHKVNARRSQLWRGKTAPAIPHIPKSNPSISRRFFFLLTIWRMNLLIDPANGTLAQLQKTDAFRAFQFLPYFNFQRGVCAGGYGQRNIGLVVRYFERGNWRDTLSLTLSLLFFFDGFCKAISNRLRALWSGR